MASGRFISYLRVSTARQGASGLGLEAQRSTVATYLNGGDWELLSEYIEVETGTSKGDNRPELDKALSRCRAIGARLIVANVSRLTRSPDFIGRIVESGVEVVFCDLPAIEGPAGKFMLRQMLAVAELEAGMISERTRKALAAAKARGVKLGGDRGNLPEVAEAGRIAGLAVRRSKASRHAGDISRVIAEIQATGVASANGIAKALNDRDAKTARGGRWSALQVQRILQTAGAPELRKP